MQHRARCLERRNCGVRARPCWVERTALGIVGGQNEVVETAQDEASPTPLPGEPPKAKDLLLGEGKSLLRQSVLIFCKAIPFLMLEYSTSLRQKPCQRFLLVA
jgi:hypothetical protein